ncbi:hypothetical protein Daus18300_009063 [Diaporthe australafricana]|uniref:DUF7580 domain-containing protein n=1 Tax=Diaporthe australafricana TaxID=127596 RepID=A0ABR3WFY9_9PEZI
MPPFNDGAGTVLVQAALRTILDIAKVLRIDADNGELRVFYADLMAYCVLISDHLNRITRAGESLACDLADSIKRRLGAILTSQGSVEDRLRELQTRWGEVQAKDRMIKTQFINSVLVFGDSHYQRVALIDFLSSWESDVLSQYPQQRSPWTAEDFAPQKKIGEPSFLVWNSAQAVFRAMTACQNCGCTPEHDFGARLCLGTYRRSGVDDDTEVDFDMFLSATRDWQEVRVHTAKEKAIQFAMDGPAPPRQPRVQASRVQRLCVPIMNAKRMMTVELKVTRERLLWLPSKRSNRLVDLTKSPVSLHEFLRGGPRAFTDKTRRILAVLLSYAVLHLQDTPWLQPTWSSSDILFFRTKDSEIPLRPFLQTRLLRTESPELEADQAQAGDCDVEDEFDPDDFDPDDQMQHPCPTIVTLAIMLMEVYFVTPFDDIARQRDVEVASDASSLTRYIAASEIFEHCRDDMPDLFVYAVEKCLDRATWEDEESTKLDSHALRSKIYEEVVLPLENDLRMGYSSISIEDLDRFAGELDFSNWDQAIRNQQAQSQDSSEHLVLEG